MEQINEMLEYMDELWKLAFSKCGNAEDADDLVQDTYLAALTAVTNGKTIEYPRTWLANTLMHIWNSKLREKYRRPVTITLNESLTEEIPEEEPDEELQVNLRRHIASLTALYRQVIVMHYVGGLSVAEIAQRLDVPEGTVKRRLHDGRQKMKKEKVTSREAEDFTPMCVSLSWNGKLNDVNLLHAADGHLVQHIIACAYRKPVSLAEMSEEIGVPVYYLEDLTEVLVEKEIMIERDGRYITDACFQYPEDYEKRNDLLEKFVSENRKLFAEYHSKAGKIVEENYKSKLSEKQYMMLKRFFFIEMLQFCANDFAGKRQKVIERPKRKDGGDWRLIGSIYPLGWEWKNKFMLGGHRSTGDNKFTLHEFDTTIYDSPCRYKNFDWIFYEGKLIYSVYSGNDPISLGVPAEMVEEMDWFIKIGLFTYDRKVGIPVLTDDEFDLLMKVCHILSLELEEKIKEQLEKLMKETALKVPSHVPDYNEETRYSLHGLEMAVCYDLFDAGIHLKDVDYCCPPAVLVVR